MEIKSNIKKTIKVFVLWFVLIIFINLLKIVSIEPLILSLSYAVISIVFALYIGYKLKKESVGELDAGIISLIYVIINNIFTFFIDVIYYAIKTPLNNPSFTYGIAFLLMITIVVPFFSIIGNILGEILRKIR